MMTEHDHKKTPRGAMSVPILTVMVGFATMSVGWCSWLSVQAFGAATSNAALTASVGDIKDEINGHIGPELDAMATRQGIYYEGTSSISINK